MMPATRTLDPVADTEQKSIEDTSIDLVPLSWCIAEIRNSLQAAQGALHEQLSSDGESDTALKQARQHLHQAHGALQVVDISGVAQLTAELEVLLGLVESNKRALTGDVVDLFSNSSHALVAYLDELLAGAPHRPVALFPYLKPLLELRGAERVHPADLFVVDLSIQAPQIESAGAAGSVDVNAARALFERGLLMFLRAQSGPQPGLIEVPPGVAEMLKAARGFEQARGGGQQHNFWWMLVAFFEALNTGQMHADVFVKRTLAKLNTQVRKMIETDQAPPETALRDLLFSIARVTQPSGRVATAQKIWSLSGRVPRDFEVAKYGAIDTVAVRDARDAIARIKLAWDKIVRGSVGELGVFADSVAVLERALGRLPVLGLQQLAQRLSLIKSFLNSKPRRLSEQTAVEVATALLFLDLALERGARSDDVFNARAPEMVARIDEMLNGQPLSADPPQWLRELSNAAQERINLAALTAEIQVNLRSTETTLDAFFRNPAKRADLAGVVPLLEQVAGALGLLGHDDAIRGVRAVIESVKNFSASAQAPELKECERVASSLGGLGFFVEALQHPNRMGGRFEFDFERGEFVAMLGETPRTPSLAMFAAAADTAIDERKRAASRLLMALNDEQPAARNAQADAAATPLLLDDADLEAKAVTALGLLDADMAPFEAPLSPPAADLAPSGAAAATDQSLDFTDTAAPIEALDFDDADQPPDTPAVLEPTVLGGEPNLSIDAELLDIFLAEADEVLGAIHTGVDAARAAPRQAEHLVTIRRGFHTLKGSGRMVGLAEIGEASWAMEQVLNLWLAEERPGNASLFGLIDTARVELRQAIDALQANPNASFAPQSVIDAAQALLRGDAIAAPLPRQSPAIVEPIEPIESIESIELIESIEPVPAAEPTARADAAPIVPAKPVEEIPLPDLSDIDLSLDFGAPGDAPAPLPSVVESIDQLPELAEIIDTEPAAQPTAGAIDIPTLDDIITAEPADKAPARADVTLNTGVADETLRALAQDMDILDEPLIADASTVAAQALEDLDSPQSLQALTMPPPAETPPPAHSADLPEPLITPSAAQPGSPPASAATVMVAGREISAALYRIFSSESAELMHTMREEIGAWAEQARPQPSARFVRAVHSLVGSSSVVGLPSVHDLAIELDGYLQSLSRHPAGWRDDDRAAVEESVAALDLMLAQFFADRQAEPAPALLDALRAARERIDTQAPPVAYADPDDDTSPLVDEHGAEPAQAARLVEASGVASDEAPAEVVFRDEIDHDLIELFFGEADEYFPRISENLRKWQAAPNDASLPQSLMRQLHTVKGSARMTGAMRLGQVVHEMETRVESVAQIGKAPPSLIEQLLADYDRAVSLYEDLKNPPAAAPASAGEAAATAPGAPTASVDLPAADAPNQAQQLIRVRSDLLDRMVNGAGEVSIARARLENEFGSLRGGLTDLTENVLRLRTQLREIEIQAESQINARTAAAAKDSDSNFDPLEFDRFTRFQELTRMLAESVNDVATVQQNLMRSLETAGNDLQRQGRLTRELQQDLMRVRMVQFGSISDRLYRVVRQAAKDTDKRVNLELVGASAEIDRGVLERMAAPIEHLLRNAVAHGIESRAERLAAGKNEAGEIRVEVRQEGNEVVLTFADDGAGLSYERIRERAIKNKLIGADTKLSDRELAELIFMPGFSTADKVSALAGRGVGMDVVRSEVAGIGGRIDTDSQRGKGTRFTIHLPLTLAVTQVVLLRCAEYQFAVPSVLVQQVMQVKPQALADAYTARQIEWQGNRVPLFYLGGLLDLSEQQPHPQRYSPILVIRSGNQRIAVHVDSVSANQEVVVKNVGAQLARLRGVAGATVLGDGEIVLIINPVQLVSTGATTELLDLSRSGIRVDDVHAALELPPTVMVVDDSLTVRKVTQRLLSREGYSVVLAKDGVDALRQTQDMVPDVMLVDIEMPRMDGFDLTRNVRADARLTNVPIIMITSRTADKHRNHAMSLGVNVFLGKPYGEDELLGHVAALIKQRAKS